MNPRARTSLAKSHNDTYLLYLKPGALARLRDSRISERSHRFNSQTHVPLYRTQSPSSPSRSPNAGTAQIAAMDDFPCFGGKLYGPRCPQRKKVMAAKSMFFISASPVLEAPDPIIDVFTNDMLLAH